MFSKKPETRSPQGTARPVASSGSTFSVIGTDVVIKGDVSATADLHVRLEGDVHYDALTIEQGAAVEGRFAPSVRRPAAASASPQQTGSDGDEPRLTLAG